MMDHNTIRPLKISNEEIIERAFDLTWQYACSIPTEYAQRSTSFDEIYETIIYPNYEIKIQENLDLGFDESGEKILGEFDPISNTAYIDICIGKQSNDPRRAFTLWHEVGGHGVLQGDWLRKEIRRIQSRRRIITTENNLTVTTHDALERQANIFAANAGIPTWLLEHRVSKVFGTHRTFVFHGPSKYDFKIYGRRKRIDVLTLSDLCHFVASQVHSSFGGMSKESIGYQLLAINRIVDITTKSTIRFRRTQKNTNSNTLGYHRRISDSRHLQQAV